MDRLLTPEEEFLLDDLSSVWTRICKLMADNPHHRGLQAACQWVVTLIHRIEGKPEQPHWYPRHPRLNSAFQWALAVIPRVERRYILFVCAHHLKRFDPELASSSSIAVDGCYKSSQAAA
jgi:hypothetical protein